ncbi:tyrosine-type recombinase/integrase [Neptunicoccus sediminis]|uniref:tyrosine-type recombinase/integrase n=1 Tax=Neptunicoccus sediminis TaxID=1892596 RepID=UPI0008461029|nr:integrase arm-type DNA-binding domain-containing protein [Neptunicoccus sediminis]
MAKSNFFTVAQLKSLPPGKHCDGQGLWLFKRKDGGAQWTFRFSLFGRQREMGLGSYPLLSLADARKAAHDVRRIVANGDDPIKIKQRQRNHASAQEGRFHVLAYAAFEAHRSTLKHEGSDGMWFSPIKNHLLPHLGMMPIVKIDQHDIKQALSRGWETSPVTAKKALSRLKVILSYAIAEGFDVNLGIIDQARILLGAPRHTVTHIAALDWAEAPAFYQSLGELAPAELALRMLMLTGVRSDAVNNMRLEQITGDIWTVPVEHVKGRKGFTKPFRVPLSGEALRVVDLARAIEQNGYLFPNSRGGPLNKMSMRNYMVEGGLEARPHGFRSTLRTWLSERTECAREVAEACLGHFAVNDVEDAYNRADYLERRKPFLAEWAGYLIGGDSC